MSVQCNMCPLVWLFQIAWYLSLAVVDRWCLDCCTCETIFWFLRYETYKSLSVCNVSLCVLILLWFGDEPSWPRLKYEDNLKNEENHKNEDDLKNEDNLKNEDDLKNEADLKIEDDLNNWPIPQKHSPPLSSP